MSDIQPELLHRLQEVARAIDNVLVAEHGARSHLRAPVPWDAPLAAAVARYGPGPVLDLWSLCRAVEALRIAWTGKAGPVAAEVAPEPDEAPGLTVEAPAAADVGAEDQQRLTEQ